MNIVNIDSTLLVYQAICILLGIVVLVFGLINYSKTDVVTTKEHIKLILKHMILSLLVMVLSYSIVINYVKGNVVDAVQFRLDYVAETIEDCYVLGNHMSRCSPYEINELNKRIKNSNKYVDELRDFEKNGFSEVVITDKVHKFISEYTYIDTYGMNPDETYEIDKFNELKEILDEYFGRIESNKKEDENITDETSEESSNDEVEG